MKLWYTTTGKGDAQFFKVKFVFMKHAFNWKVIVSEMYNNDNDAEITALITGINYISTDIHIKTAIWNCIFHIFRYFKIFSFLYFW